MHIWALCSHIRKYYEFRYPKFKEIHDFLSDEIVKLNRGLPRPVYGNDLYSWNAPVTSDLSVIQYLKTLIKVLWLINYDTES